MKRKKYASPKVKTAPILVPSLYATHDPCHVPNPPSGCEPPEG